MNIRSTLLFIVLCTLLTLAGAGRVLAALTVLPATIANEMAMTFFALGGSW